MDFDYNKTYNKMRYKERKENKLCVRCNKQDERTLNGGALCQKCVDEKREERKNCSEEERKRINEANDKYKKKCIAQNRCKRCGKQDAYTLTGKTHCYECTQKISEYHKKYENENKEKIAERKKKRHQELIDKGICTQCRKRPAREGKTQCEICALKKKARDYKKTHSKWRDPDLCSRCHKNEKFKEFELCETCYNNALKGIKNAHAKLDEMRANGEILLVKNRDNSLRYQYPDNIWIDINKIYDKPNIVDKTS